MIFIDILFTGKPAQPTHRNDPDWVPTLQLGEEAENTDNLDLLALLASSVPEVLDSQEENLHLIESSAQCGEESDNNSASEEDEEDTSRYVMLEPGVSFEHDENTADFGEYFENKEVHVGVLGGLPSDSLLHHLPETTSKHDSTLNDSAVPVTVDASQSNTPCCSASKDYSDLSEKYQQLRNYCTDVEVDKLELEKSFTESQSLNESLTESFNNDIAVIQSALSSMKRRLSDLTDVNSQQAKKLKLMKEEKERLQNVNEKLKKSTLCLDNLLKIEGDMVFYTGLPNCKMFDVLLKFVLPRADYSDRQVLTPGQCLLLTLMRLRLAVPLQDLAYRFGISKATASRVFDIWLHAVYLSVKRLVNWPDREILRKTMPRSFQIAFGNKIAVIIDCFEVFIDRPSSLAARAMTWSSYKHHNTVKFLIGITPGGSISFISNAWGGRSSDKHITQNCSILERLLPNDVLADRGFDISVDVGLSCARVVMPAFKGRRAQLSGLDVVDSRKIASCRIHVERVIGLVRNKYPVLKSTLPIEYLVTREGKRTQIDEIVTVCCALTNLSTSVVPSW